MAYRRDITDFAYYLNGTFSKNDRPLLNNQNYLKFLTMFRETRVWMPENDRRREVSSAECKPQTPEFFSFKSMRFKTYLEEFLQSFTALARKNNVKLIVVFQPVACIFGTGQGSAIARKVIDEFKRANPDVEIPFPLIESWPSEMFSVPAHVADEHIDLTGNRLGKALKEIIRRD